MKFFLGLRQAVMTNNHRSATVSPSSENSPSQDMQSEEGSYPHPGGGGFNQYSSQDSLPDSPYSSQSLDSQPAPGQGKQRFLFWIMHPNTYLVGCVIQTNTRGADYS